MGTRSRKPEPQECAEATAPFPVLELGAGGPGPLRVQQELLSQPARGLTGLNSLPSCRLMPEGGCSLPPPCQDFSDWQPDLALMGGVSLLPLSHLRETPQCLFPSLVSLLSDMHGLQVQVPRMRPQHCAPSPVSPYPASEHSPERFP